MDSCRDLAKISPRIRLPSDLASLPGTPDTQHASSRSPREPRACDANELIRYTLRLWRSAARFLHQQVRSSPTGAVTCHGNKFHITTLYSTCPQPSSPTFFLGPLVPVSLILIPRFRTLGATPVFALSASGSAIGRLVASYRVREHAFAHGDRGGDEPDAVNTRRAVLSDLRL